MGDQENKNQATPDEDIDELRRHWEGVQDDEAASHNVPDFFSFHIGQKLRNLFWRRSDDAKRQK